METPNSNAPIWTPKVGDWFILKASYCGGETTCSKENPCAECLEMCNRFVIAAEHCGKHFFFGGGWCNRTGGSALNETYSAVLTLDASEVSPFGNVHHVSEAIPIVHPDVMRARTELAEAIAQCASVTTVSKLLYLALEKVGAPVRDDACEPMELADWVNNRKQQQMEMLQTVKEQERRIVALESAIAAKDAALQWLMNEADDLRETEAFSQARKAIALTPADAQQTLKTAREADGAALIAAERQRQLTAEGWTPEHDDQHEDGELADAAVCYIDGSSSRWPWEMKWWKPSSNRVRSLVKAGALIAAEIDRLKRAALATLGGGE